MSRAPCLAPGGVVAGRYELLGVLGGEDEGPVYAARDWMLDCEVALRMARPDDPTSSQAMLEQLRRLTGSQFRALSIVSVLDEGIDPAGVRYVAMELVRGTALDEVVRDQAPLPADEVVRYGIELLDACLAARRGEAGRSDLVPAAAMVTAGGHVLVTRFERAPSGPGGADPACAVAGDVLHRLATGREPGRDGPRPGAAELGELGQVIGDALAERVATADELRGRLQELRPAPAYEAPGAHRRTWPLVLLSLAILAVVALLVILVVL